MFELRILSGLHRGAALPLDGRALEIGADDDAGIVLVDPGIETRHASLAQTDGGWTLNALDGALLGTEHNQPLASLTLQAGDFARLGHVWLCIAGQDDPWENPPPEPAGHAADHAAGHAAHAKTADPDDDGPHRDTPLDDLAAAPEQTPGPQAAQEERQEPTLHPSTQQAAPAFAATPKRTAAKATRAAGWRRSKMIVLPLALATILSACAAYSITSHTEQDGAPGAAKAAEQRGAAGKDAGQAAAQLAAAFASRPGSASSASPALPASSSPGASGSPASSVELASSASPASATPSSSATAAQSPARQRKPSPQALREAFRSRLAEVDLLKRINLDLRDNEWTMQASLDSDEAARFDRILKAFVQAHGIKFPVHARVGSAEVMLPFRVREVITGTNANIVTQDGRRLYVGDEYRGLRLVAVEGGHLQFDGERKIKVQW